MRSTRWSVLLFPTFGVSGMTRFEGLNLLSLRSTTSMTSNVSKCTGLRMTSLVGREQRREYSFDKIDSNPSVYVVMKGVIQSIVFVRS